jgi:hypothetical protein
MQEYEPRPALPAGRLRLPAVRAEDLSDIELPQGLRDQVRALMTPQEVLEQAEFAPPEIILPEYYPSFSALLGERNRIRDLQLVPVKTVQDRAVYHAVPKQMLVRLVERSLGDSSMAYVPNLFRDNLPPDVEQHIIWMRSQDVSREDIVEFIAKIIQSEHLSPEDIILFERPLKTDASFIRGTMAEYRHVHLWKCKVDDHF